MSARITYPETALGEWKWRILDGDNQTVIQSDGTFTSQADAKEAFERVKRAIASTVFAPEWPGGIQHLSMPSRMVSDEPGGPLEPEGEPVSRVESGPTQFGDDWPGLWLRGDSCFAYVLALKAERSQKADAFSRAGVDGLITALESTNIHKP